MHLKVKGEDFLDPHGRRVYLRGINVGGSSKLPLGRSFVGRPFPLSEADSHFKRLKEWGFNSLRLLTTWEAIEPDTPGEYDEEYLDYFRKIVQRAKEYGFLVFIDPHQDVWSRWTGGDGAPSWTLDLVGFEKDKLDESEAAITLKARYPNYDRMTWPNNWNRLGSATMFTLFFAGKKFAPNFKIGSEFADDFFQRHFINAMCKVAEAVRDFDHVMGYDSLNEPSAGYIGIRSLSEPRPVYHRGPQLTGFQSIYIPGGISARVPYVARDRLSDKRLEDVLLNPNRQVAWKKDLWRDHGVYDVDSKGEAQLLKDDYFADANFSQDFLKPFLRRYALAMREKHPNAILFVEDQPGSERSFEWDSDIPIVNANHWYDLLTLITRHYNPEEALTWADVRPVRGRDAVIESFQKQIGFNVEYSKKLGCPTLIGEFGVPFDLDEGASFKTSDYSHQTAALSTYYDVIDHWLVHSALWNYTSDNNNSFGDQWNLEDLSVYSEDGGGRGVPGFCRPTVHCAAGKIVRQEFLREPPEYLLEIETDDKIQAPTVIFIPRVWFSENAEPKVTSGSAVHEGQLYFWRGAESGKQSFRVKTST